MIAYWSYGFCIAPVGSRVARLTCSTLPSRLSPVARSPPGRRTENASPSRAPNERNTVSPGTGAACAAASTLAATRGMLSVTRLIGRSATASDDLVGTNVRRSESYIPGDEVQWHDEPVVGPASALVEKPGSAGAVVQPDTRPTDALVERTYCAVLLRRCAAGHTSKL